MTKRNLAFVASALLLVSLASSLTSCGSKTAQVMGSEGLAYTLSEDGTYYSLTGFGTCKNTDVVIGNYHEGKPVKDVLKSALCPYSTPFGLDLTSITVSDGITGLGECWAACNEKLESIYLPDGIESLGVGAFLLDGGMKNLYIGKGLKSLEVDTFEKTTANLMTIFFSGSKTEWDAVKVAEKGNDNLATFKVVTDYKR